MAVELLAGLSVDIPHVSLIFAQDPHKYVSRLFSKLSDQPPVAALAWDSLINYAIDEKVALFLFDNHLGKILSSVKSKQLVFADAATKLLANMTKHVESRPSLSTLVPDLLPLYLAGSRHNSHTDYSHVASILADLTNLREARLYFVQDLGCLESLLSDLHSPSVIRRGGVASIIKNCLFETDFHDAIFEKEVNDDFIITSLSGRLLDSRSKLSAEELEGLPVELQLLNSVEAESDVAIRSIIIECLIILATTRKGRDVIRAKKIYPILREWHLLEPISEMKQLVEKMVELLIRDEELIVSH
jgi:hypothetical protein